MPPVKMTLKVYYDLMSQPCRALVIFLKANNIPYEECPVALRKGEHMTDEFAKINPFKRVPAIDHDGFKLAETMAIMRYLCTQFPVADHWFPKDPRHRAKVDEYLAWQHLNLRMFGSMMFQNRVLRGIKEPKEPYATGLKASINAIQHIFLANGQHKWINGMDDISFADVLCACEMEQPMMAGWDIFNENEKVRQYHERVIKRMSPIYQDVHKVSKVLKDRVAAGKL